MCFKIVVIGKTSGLIAFVNDLHAADALYQQQCSANFRTGTNIPNKRGRPETNRAAAFLEVTQFLEDNDEGQATISELVTKMTEDLVDTGQDPYSGINMQHGDRVPMTAYGAKDCVVTLRDTASFILHAFHTQCKLKM